MANKTTVEEEKSKITSFTSTVRRSTRLSTPQKLVTPQKRPASSPTGTKAFPGGLVTGHFSEDAAEDVEVPNSPIRKNKKASKTLIEEPEIESLKPKVSTEVEQKVVETKVSAPQEIRKIELEPKLLATPLKSESLPAYLRYAHLASPGGVTVLPLPSHFELALTSFSALDTVCMLLEARSQRFIFHKSQEAVEKITRRSFTPRLLGQILSLWPEAYSTEPVTIIKDGRRCKTISLTFPPSDSITPIELESRRQHFRSLLVKLVTDAHTHFLESQKIFLPKGKKLLNWHPKFDLEGGVLELTEKPLFESKPVLSSGVVSARVQEAFDLQDRQTHSKLITTEPSLQTSSQKFDSLGPTPQEPSKKQPKLSLLDRIKAKESQAALDKMTGSAASKQQQLAALTSLCDEFIDIVFLAFTSSKKATLPRAYLEERLLASCKSATSNSSLKQKFDLAATVCPSWLSYITNMQGQEFVKIDKTKTPKDVKAAVEEYKKVL